MKRSFTLVELVVVVGVTALLAGILLPALNAAGVDGKKADCTYKLKQAGIAMTMYAGENDNFIPVATAHHNRSLTIPRTNSFDTACAGPNFHCMPSLLLYGGYFGVAQPVGEKLTREVVAPYFQCPEDNVVFGTGDGKPFLTMSYIYMCHSAEEAANEKNDPRNFLHEGWKKDGKGKGRRQIGVDKPGRAILFDMHAEAIGHTVPAAKGTTFHPDVINTLYLDGSVKANAVTLDDQKGGIWGWGGRLDEE